MAGAPKQKHSGIERDPHDFYVEPAWCVRALADEIKLQGTVHDPCCGIGTIPKTLALPRYGLDAATGSDIVNRVPDHDDSRDKWLWLGECDFRARENFYWDSVVSNPPYGLTQEFIEFFATRTQRYLAVLVRLDFLASQKRYELFTELPPWRVLVLSRRPSMPPGGLDIPAKGGQHDYCWIVWNCRRRERVGRQIPRIKWLLPDLGDGGGDHEQSR